MPDSKQVAETTDADVPDVSGPRISEQFTGWLQRAADANEGTRTFDVAAGQLDRLLTAESVDDILDADEQGTLQLRDMVGVQLRIPNPGFPGCVRKSSEKYSATLGVYIQFPATVLAVPDKYLAAQVGDDVLVSTGAPLVIGKLRSMEANGYLPFDFLVTGVEAANGTVLKLRRVPGTAS